MLFLATWPALTLAQDSENAARAVEIAQEAAADFQNEKFQDAARKFERAFELYPDATLLKNQAVAHYKGGNCAKALASATAYRSFTASRQDISEKDRNDVAKVTVECEYDAALRYVESNEFELAQSALDDARSAGPTPEMTQKINDLQAKVDAGPQPEPEADPNREEPALSDSTSPDDGSVDALPIVGWSTLGAGVALGAVTGILHIMAFTKASSGRDACASDGFPNEQCAQIPGREQDYQDWIDGADTINGLTPLWITSGVLGAAGAGILIYYYATRSESDIAIAPAIGPQGAQVLLNVRF